MKSVRHAIAIIAMTPSAILLAADLYPPAAVQPAPGISATQPSAKNERVYFASPSNPFWGYYTRNEGFRASRKGMPRDEIAAADELLRPWRRALKETTTFPGLSRDMKPIDVRIKKIQTPKPELGASSFITKDQTILFWSSRNLELLPLGREAVELDVIDQKIIRHEALARALEAKVGNDQPGGELNPNPTPLLDPSEPGNLRITSFAPIKGSKLILVHVELYFTMDGKKHRYENGLLLLYSKAEHAIVDRVFVESPEFHLFQINGDINIYLMYQRFCTECDGLTIQSIGHSATPHQKEGFFVNRENSTGVWTY